MIEGLKPYADYKKSGLPWLEIIPRHWQTARNGNLFQQRNDTRHPELPVLEVSLRTGVRVREFSSSKRKQVMADATKYKRASVGDIAYNMMRMWQGAVGVAPVDGLVSPAYVVARPFPGTNSCYYASLFKNGLYMGEIDAVSRGIVKDRNRLYWDQFKQMRSPAPLPDEQTAIVRFLDHANRKIDGFIRAKRKLIGLLNEQKQAIIHRAVTRGLDPNVLLKPSGIPWLGDIPAHWETITVGASTTLIQTGPFGSQMHSNEYLRGGTPIINPSHMKDGAIVADMDVAVGEGKLRELARHRMLVGDIVAARRGELGRCALVTGMEEGWLCGTGSLLVRLKREIFNPGYFQEVFSSQGVCDLLRLASVGATMDNLNAGMVGRLRFPLPSIDEQAAILKFMPLRRFEWVQA